MDGRGDRVPWGVVCMSAVSVSFFLTVFVPVNAYINNFAEFPLVGIGQVWKVAIGLFFLLSTVLSLVLIVVCRFKMLFALVLSLITGFSLALYVQGNLINLDYGVLDGHDIPWDKMVFKGIVNTCVWLAIVIGVVWQTLKRSAAGIASVRLVMSVFLAYQCLVLGMKSFSANFSSSEPAQMTERNLMRLSSGRNVLVFMLDTLECSLFEKILMQHPEVSDWLRGFTWHRNTIGLYPTTKGALPQIITGVANDNAVPYPVYKEHAYKTSKIMREAKANGFGMDLYVSPVFAPPKAMLGDMGFLENTSGPASSDSDGRAWNGFVSVVNSAIFTYLPHFLKRYHQKFAFDVDFAGGDDDSRVVNSASQIEKRLFAAAGKRRMTATDGRSRYKFYTLDGVHPPEFTVSKGRECLDKLRAYFDEMRELGVWSNATVVVLADHGFINKERPVILCYDRSGDRPLQIVDEPFSYSDLERVFCSALRSEAVKFPVSTGDRPFHYYSWGICEIKNEDYLPKFFDRAYDLEGNQIEEAVSAKDSYRPEDFPLLKVDSVAVDGTYPNVWMWTLGTNATVFLPVPAACVGNPLQLEMATVALLGPKKKNQHLSCVVNEAAVGEFDYAWPGGESRNVRLDIPAEANTNAVMVLSLHVTSPITPEFWASSSADTRPLGIRINEFTLSQPGQTRPFSFCDDSKCRAITGLDGIESDGSGRWTLGKNAKLEITVPKELTGRNLRMTWRINPFLARGKVERQGLKIQSSGRVLFDRVLSDPVILDIDFRIPAELVVEGRIPLELTLPDAVAPKDVGYNADPRKLAIFLRSCKMELAE